MLSHQRGLDDSELNRLIAPEITRDAFHDLIKHLAATETLDAVLEIGSSSGGGSTEAFAAGLAQNPASPKLFCIEVSKPRFQKLQEAYRDYPFIHCYNCSTVTADQFPTPEAVATFYRDVRSSLRKTPLPVVLNWLRQDVQYVRDSGVEAGAIGKIKADHGIETFDMVLIDGSEFTGEIEYAQVKGARLILLDDTNSFKCYAVRRTLLNDPMYDLIADDQELRNGYSVFRRRATARRIGDTLPIHFFTIVLNGEPFIRYHETVFKRLTVPWHWHVIEGVASLKHDTAWSVANGGHIPAGVHEQGRSNDGTSAYLDDVARRFPENVTIYRKPLGQFWDGKREMVNAPLPSIQEACLLWQIDNDELWTVEQVQTVHEMFARDPARTAAYYWCWYYVGPDKIVSTRHNYSQHSKEWLRTWRYQPGAIWAAHEPPRLVVTDGNLAHATDIATVNPFTQDDTEQMGAVFHHFAYATDEQVAFKELYYGYEGARAEWRALQAYKGSGLLRDFFGWVQDAAMFDDASRYLVDPIARFDAATARWTFDGLGLLSEARRRTAVPRPRVLVDGLCWQYPSPGMDRVWKNLLHEWVASSFADNIVVLDRAGTAPRLPGVHYWTIARHDYSRTGYDSLYIEALCRKLDADIFVSTYDSASTTTPSLYIGYDMMPKAPGFPPRNARWREKQRAILHASAHCMVSGSSAEDLEAAHPSIARRNTYVTHCGVDPVFVRPSDDALTSFRLRYGLIEKPYALMVGERLGVGGYKNGILAFRALADLPDEKSLVLICVGGRDAIEPELREFAPKLDARRLALSDTDLCAAYAGAHVLLYPSKYEGFGMPPLESMACGTPVIVCRNSSLPEVAGDAALYVDANDPADMTNAIMQLYDPIVRADLVERGVGQAARFTFAGMARELAEALVETHDRVQTGLVPRPNALWTELRSFQHGCQIRNVDVPVAESAEDDAGQILRSAPDREFAQALEVITAMRSSRFWKARELAVRLLRRAGLRTRA